jgi:hypothetical protein
MEADPPALILARNRGAMRGTSRVLSRAYTNGALVRVRHGIYYSKAAWISIRAWERYAVTTAAVASGDPSAVFCYLAALRLWRLPVPGVTRDEVKRAAELITSATKRSRVLEVLALADGTAESVGESRSRALIHVLGLPTPVLQQAFHDAEGFLARADFFWREYGVIGEFDGEAPKSLPNGLFPTPMPGN